MLFAVGALAIEAARPQIIRVDPQQGVEQIAARLAETNEGAKLHLGTTKAAGL